MLRVTYEIIPFGDEGHQSRRVIAVQEIGNLNMMEDGECPYVSTLKTDGKMEDPTSKVYVDHPRRAGAFELVRKCLEAHLE